MADFDPDAYLKQKTAAPAQGFDPDQYLAEKAGGTSTIDAVGNTLDTAGEGVAKVAGGVAGLLSPITSRYEKYVTGPTRAFSSNLEEGRGLGPSLSAAKEQFGEEPKKEYSGKEQEKRYLARHNMKDVSLSELYPNAFNDTGAGIKLQRGGPLDISKSGLYGTARDVIQDPLLIAGEAVRGIPKAAEALGTAGEAVKTKALRGYSKLAELRTGIPADAVENYAKNYDKINEMIKQYGKDVPAAADAIKEGFNKSIQETRKLWSGKITDALDSMSKEKTIPVNDIADSIMERGSKLDPRLPNEASQIKELEEMTNTVRSLADEKGRVSPGELFKIKEYLQGYAKGSYLKNGQVFSSGPYSQKIARYASFIADSELAKTAPEIRQANRELSKLHRLEETVNKNVIKEGKSSATLIAAGSGGNRDTARQLTRIGQATGTDALQQAKNLSSMNSFSDTPLGAVDTTGKSLYRLAGGAGAGGILGGLPGAVAGAVATSPAAVKKEIQAGQLLGKIPKKGLLGRGVLKAEQVREAERQ